MQRLSKWWRGCQVGFGIRAGYPHARRRTAWRLESLEQRLNLAAVLVVETLDAYWLIEDPEFSSLDPASGDVLYGEDDHDEMEMGLPSDVALTAASGDSLNSAESDLAWSLLNELWDTEPDFFYEDVMAMTFYSDTTMDSVLASGLFDDTAEPDSFIEDGLVTTEPLDDADLSAPTESDSLASASSSDLADSPFAADEALPEALSTDTETLLADASDALDLAKAEAASWSQQLDAQSSASSGALWSVADGTATASFVPAKFVVASDSKFDPAARAGDEPAARESTSAPAEAAARSSQDAAVAAAEPRTVDSFFARFPAFFGMRVSQALRMPLARGAGDSAGVDASADLVEADAAWSYSQWASLVGAAGLTAAGFWTPTELATAPFRTKPNDKRPTVC